MGDRVGVLVLAAGSSRRLGRPKQLLDLEGRPLLQHVIDAAAAAGSQQIVVVLGHAEREIRAAIALPPNAVVAVNPDFATGQASSLRVGLDALAESITRAVVVLGDQPRVSPEVIGSVAHAKGPIARATYAGIPSHPVAFDRALWPELHAVEGDRGARDVLASHAGDVTLVRFSGPPPGDVDTDEDYQQILRSPTRMSAGNDALAGDRAE